MLPWLQLQEESSCHKFSGCSPNTALILLMDGKWVQLKYRETIES